MSVPEVKIKWWHYVLSIPYTFFFLTILIVFDAGLRIASLMSYRLFRTVEYWMCRMIHLNLKVFAGASIVVTYDDGFSTLPTLKHQPLLVISNHQSMYDVSLLDEVFSAHDPRFISKKELAKWVPAVSFISRNNNTVLIDRTDRAQSLRAMKDGAIKAVMDKAALCIFPEGTRAREGRMQPFKIAGTLALLETMSDDTKIVPVAIDGSWQFLRYKFFPVPWGVQVLITVGTPVLVDKSRVRDQIKEVEEFIFRKLT